MSEQEEASELGELEQQLRMLPPKPSAGLRDRVMFEAGRRSRSRVGPWLGAAAALVVGVGLGFEMPRHVEPRVVERLIHVPAPAETPPPTTTPTYDDESWSESLPGVQAAYLRMRNQMLRHGVESMPLPRPVETAQTSPMTLKQLLEQVR
jgi:hypothetical protein